MSRRDVRRFIVAYDVPDDRRRTRLATVLQSYGDRVQFSVFVVDAAEVKMRRMRRALEAVVVRAQDSVLIADLGSVMDVEASRYVVIGRGRPITETDSFIL